MKLAFFLIFIFRAQYPWAWPFKRIFKLDFAWELISKLRNSLIRFWEKKNFCLQFLFFYKNNNNTVFFVVTGGKILLMTCQLSLLMLKWIRTQTCTWIPDFTIVFTCLISKLYCCCYCRRPGELSFRVQEFLMKICSPICAWRYWDLWRENKVLKKSLKQKKNRFLTR